MKSNPDDYAQWETEGGTTQEQNEAHFSDRALAISDACPQPDLGVGEGDIQAEVT